MADKHDESGKSDIELDCTLTGNSSTSEPFVSQYEEEYEDAQPQINPSPQPEPAPVGEAEPDLEPVVDYATQCVPLIPGHIEGDYFVLDPDYARSLMNDIYRYPSSPPSSEGDLVFHLSLSDHEEDSEPNAEQTSASDRRSHCRFQKPDGSFKPGEENMDRMAMPRTNIGRHFDTPRDPGSVYRATEGYNFAGSAMEASSRSEPALKYTWDGPNVEQGQVQTEDMVRRSRENREKRQRRQMSSRYARIRSPMPEPIVDPYPAQGPYRVINEDMRPLLGFIPERPVLHPPPENVCTGSLLNKLMIAFGIGMIPLLLYLVLRIVKWLITLFE